MLAMSPALARKFWPALSMTVLPPLTETKSEAPANMRWSDQRLTELPP